MLVYKFKFFCRDCGKIILSEKPEVPKNCIGCRGTNLIYNTVRKFDEFEGDIDSYPEILALISRLKRTTIDINKALEKLAGRFKTHYKEKDGTRKES